MQLHASFLILSTVSMCIVVTDAWMGSNATSRRLLLQKTLGSFLAIAGSKAILKHPPPPSSSSLPNLTSAPATSSRFVYSSDWIGTNLPLLSVEQAATYYAVGDGATPVRWPMARWPDPVLRHIADPVPPELFGTEPLKTACWLLERTAVHEKAVGLAAQQCGVNARIVHLQRRRSLSLTMINPRIVQRSPEADMRVWIEHCLVLPPTFAATVLRDAWVNVEFQDISGHWHAERLEGETARAAQHELDHDHGILVTDHVSVAELENDLMRSVEAYGHEERMKRAYARVIEDGIVLDRGVNNGGPKVALLEAM